MLTCRYNQIRRKIKRFSPSAGTLLCLYALFASELPSEAFFEEKREILIELSEIALTMPAGAFIKQSKKQNEITQPPLADRF